MKSLACLFLTPLCLLPFCLHGQGVFTRVTDPDNPAVVFANTAARYKSRLVKRIRGLSAPAAA